MPVILKQVQKQKKVEQTSKTLVEEMQKVDLVQKVDDYLDLYSECAALEANLNKIKKDKTETQAAIVNSPEVMALQRHEDIVLHGKRATLEVGPRQNERRIAKNMRAVHKLLGDDLFYSMVKINIGDIDTYVDVQKKEQLLVEERTGPRRLKVYLKK
jgi:hypothetical protein